MNSRVPLILKKEPVSGRVAGPVSDRTPDVAVVYATGSGDVAVFDPGRPDGWTKRVFAGYRLRYEVDLGDHRRTVELRSSPLPARGSIHAFESFFDVGFRVVDPREIVTRDVDDGLTVVYSHLIDVCRPITRQFDIEDSVSAEDALNERFARGEVLEEGILLYRCRARLGTDSSVHDHRKAQAEAKWANQERWTLHELDADDVTRQHHLDMMRQQATLDARHRERAALGNRPLDFHELIAIHLERFPDDTQTAMRMLNELEKTRWERRELQEERASQLFTFLTEKNLIHAVDLNHFRDQVLSELRGPYQVQSVRNPGSYESLPHHPDPQRLQGPPRVPRLPPSGWDDPLPQLDADELAAPAATPTTPHRPEPTDTPAAPVVAEVAGHPGVVPVYVLIDRSMAVQSWVPELNAGVNALYDALLAEPAIASIVRLSVFGYADDVAVQLGSARVQEGTERIPLAAQGAAGYTAAFERLLECIPRDVELLKSEEPFVRRPQVLFLSGAQPTDDWNAPYRRLVDRNQHRYAPMILACGFGTARAETIARIATSQELAFMAESGEPTVSVQRYFAFVTQHLLGYGRSVLEGTPGPLVRAPDGFRSAFDLV